LTTSATETGVCARCGREKPAAEFKPNVLKDNGLDSWCRDCYREYFRERQQRGETSPHTTAISKSFDRAEALDYSRAVCEHVAWYVERKIAEFEAAHFMEAPPHLTAIRTIAKSIAAQHPRPKKPKGSWDITCRRCGEMFQAKSPRAEYCHACSGIRRKEQKRDYNRLYYRSPAGRLSRSKEPSTQRRKQRLEKNCEVCGAHMFATAKQKYCDQCRREREVERAKKLTRRGPREAQCKQCGSSFMSTCGQHKFCDMCTVERERVARRAYKQRMKERRRVFPSQKVT
jgi:hypothetical protein